MFEQEVDEQQWLQASLAGNAQAFEALVLKYQSLVCAITYSATGNVAQSEDLAQDIFLKAWKNLHQLQDFGKFRPWLCRIARTTVQNWFRSRKRDTTTQAAPLEVASGTPSTEPGPDENAMRREHEALVNQALAQLPEQQREALILYYREHQSTQAVAQQLEISEVTVRQRVSRGRQALRNQMQSLVEQTLADTRPSKAFATGVVTSIAALTAKSTTASTATAVHALGGGLSGIAGKLSLVAAGLAILAGTWAITKKLNTPAMPTVQNSQQISDQQTTNAPTPMLSPPPPHMIPSQMAPMQNHIANVKAKADSILEPVLSEETKHAKSRTSPPRTVLSGLITDAETGTPIAGAKVQLKKTGQEHRTVTDSNGFYSFAEIDETGTFQVVIDPGSAFVGYPWNISNTQVQLNPKQPATQHFPLDRACQVAITVVDVNGVGIPKTTVRTISLAGSSHHMINLYNGPRTTDPNGFLLSGSLPPAETEYCLMVTHQQNVPQNRGRYVELGHQRDYAPTKANLRLTDPNQITELTVVLKKGESVHGYVEYADGNPATSIELTAQPDWWPGIQVCESYPVNEDGTFTIKHITPGTYDISVRFLQDKGGDGSIHTVLKTELPLAEGVPLLVNLPQASTPSFASIRGTVKFLGSKPPKTTRITMRNLAKPGTSIHQIDKKNTFEITGLKGNTYELTFITDKLFERKTLEVVAPCSDLLVEIRPTNTSPPKLMGKVLDLTTNKPIQSFKLRKYNLITPPMQHQWIGFSNKEGLFTCDVETHSVYRVQVLAEGYAPLWSEDIHSDSNEPTTLYLCTGGTLTGTVVDELGVKLAGAKVISHSLASGASQQTLSSFVSDYGAVTTAQDGTFTLKNRPPGRESIKVIYPNLAFSIVEGLDVLTNQITSCMDIILYPGATIEGLVFDDSGKPQANQLMNLRLHSDYSHSFVDPLASTTTDSDGFYRFEHAPIRPCVVHRVIAPNEFGVSTRDIMPINHEVHRLDFGGTPMVYGSIVIDNQALANCRLLLGNTESKYRGDFTYFAQSNKLGDFVLRGIPSGTHTIYYAHPVQEKQWVELITFEMGTEDLDLGVITKTKD